MSRDEATTNWPSFTGPGLDAESSPRGAEVEILAEALTRVDDNGRGFRSEACVENPDTSAAGGHARKCVEAERVSERGQRGPIDGDAGALENLAVGGEGHEAGEGAGARCGSVGGRGKRTEDQCE
jgi:hypothetical protein